MISSTPKYYPNNSLLRMIPENPKNVTTFDHIYFLYTGIAYIICFALGSFLNFSVIAYLLANFQKLVLSRTSGILILSLAICDFLYVILALLYGIQHVTGNFVVFGYFSCLLPGFDIALMHVNIWTTFGICVQRLAAIKWPFDYPHIFTRKRCTLISLIVWATSFVVGIPMAIMFRLQVFTEPESGESKQDCHFRGTGGQFMAANAFVYTCDFILPAILVTKYYWDFSKEVRRRSRGIIVNAAPPAAPPVDNDPRADQNNAFLNSKPDHQNGEHVQRGSQSNNNPNIIINNNSHRNNNNNSNNYNNNNSHNLNNVNNNNTINGQQGTCNNTLLAHRFLQVYAGVISLSCWICYTPFYNLKFIQSIDVMTGMHIAGVVKPLGLGPYIERTSTALTHLNSLANPILFIGLKMYMKAEKAKRLRKRSNATANHIQEQLRNNHKAAAEYDDNEEHEVEGFKTNRKDFNSIEMQSKMTLVNSVHDTNNNNNCNQSSV